MAPSSHVARIVIAGTRGDRSTGSTGLPSGAAKLSPTSVGFWLGVVRGLERARVGERGFGQVAGDALEPNRQRAQRRRATIVTTGW